VIDRRPFQMALAQAEGALQRDEAQLQNARLQLERFRTLLGQDSIAEQEVDAQAATVKQLEGTVAADRAAVGSARLNLDFSEVKSPVAGRVGLRVIDIGNYIGAGDASGIVVVTQIAPTDVAFTVPQDRANEIFEPVGRGEKLAATALDRTRTSTLAQGQFLTLDNVVNTDTGTVRAKARFQNAENTLFPSQFVNLRLTLRTIRDAVVVPASAVRNGSNGDFVWLIQADKTVTQRNIKRGQVTTDKVQVLEGLKPGDQIVTEGGDRLKEGAQVTLPGDKPRQFTPGQRPNQGQGQGERRRRRNNGEGGPPGGGPGGGAGGPPPGAP
jgi:multidrug efflux system membrane fusion protein